MTTPDPYAVYLGAASQNPGRAAAAVLVARGERAVAKHLLIDHADYQEAVWAALHVGLGLLATKPGAPVELVVPSPTMLAVMASPSGADTKLLALGKEALERFNAARGADAQATARLPRPDERSLMQKVHDAAYAAAFPPVESRPVVAGPETSTTEGGVTATR